MPGGQLKRTKGVEVERAAYRLDDLLPFRYQRHGSRRIARPGVPNGKQVESGG